MLSKVEILTEMHKSKLCAKKQIYLILFKNLHFWKCDNMQKYKLISSNWIKDLYAISKAKQVVKTAGVKTISSRKSHNVCDFTLSAEC